MTLEQQLSELAKLGLHLAEGVSIDDLLYSFDREAFEAEPFDLILFVLGGEVERRPWGRAVCSRVWNFDTECIEQTGDYVRIVSRLCELAGVPDRLTDILDFVDLETGKAWLEYKVGDVQRHWNIQVDDDWADTQTLSYVMADIQSDGYRFYSKDNGQAVILFYLDARTAARLNELSGGALSPALTK